MSKSYHYTESGLDNVFLENGFVIEESSFGALLSIHNIDGLHQAIGRNLASRSLRNGREFRFLRHELNLSQKALSAMMGCTEQTVANWEKGTAISALANATVRKIYLEQLKDDSELTDMLREYSELDSTRLHLEEQLSFLEDDQTGWKKAA